VRPMTELHHALEGLAPLVLPIDYLADNEDGVSWFSRHGVVARRARAEYARNSGCRPITLKASAVHLRPLSVADCSEQPHGDFHSLDDDERDRLIDAGCRCGEIEDGWWFECGGDHPEAVTAWRVEPREAPMFVWKIRRAKREIHRRLYPSRGVLWGGRPERRANRFDRFMLGPIVLVSGDYQLRPGSGVVLYCPVCKLDTLHRPAGPNYTGGRWHAAMCLAYGHHHRAWAARDA
jgi:hypothetical protein